MYKNINTPEERGISNLTIFYGKEVCFFGNIFFIMFEELMLFKTNQRNLKIEYPTKKNRKSGIFSPKWRKRDFFVVNKNPTKTIQHPPYTSLSPYFSSRAGATHFFLSTCTPVPFFCQKYVVRLERF